MGSRPDQSGIALPWNWTAILGASAGAAAGMIGRLAGAISSDRAGVRSRPPDVAHPVVEVRQAADPRGRSAYAGPTPGTWSSR